MMVSCYLKRSSGCALLFHHTPFLPYQKINIFQAFFSYFVISLIFKQIILLVKVLLMIGLANIWGTADCVAIIEIADLAILFAKKLILGHSHYCSYYSFNQSASFMHQQWHNISRIPIVVSIPITHILFKDIRWCFSLDLIAWFYCLLWSCLIKHWVITRNTTRILGQWVDLIYVMCDVRNIVDARVSRSIWYEPDISYFMVLQYILWI
jgi:hypothetical protein